MILTKAEDIEMIREAGRVAGATLHAISLLAEPGISTWETRPGSRAPHKSRRLHSHVSWIPQISSHCLRLSE